MSESSTGKRLALFFDGTWNVPQNNTNVWRQYLMLSDCSPDGRPQRSFYDEGVGTRWYYRLAGGMFGFGLGGNVREGYRWLMQHYDEGDEIYIFGFSRGAFTARSLAGVIANCGILTPNAPMGFWDVFARYKKGAAVRPIYKLKYAQQCGKSDFDSEEKILLNHARYHRKLIKMVGVWDTVGFLGLPFGNIKGISSSTLRFHNTHLSTVVDHSYQALALDEHRRQYWGMLWTHFVPNGTPVAPSDDLDDRFIEQRWFAGSHCNVGGGYREDLVSQRPLAWLQSKAVKCGLGFRGLVVPTDDDYAVATRDSYAEFLGGIYRFVNFRGRYVRWVQSDPVPKKTGTVQTVNERIDNSVFERCRRNKHYRPRSLSEWADRKDLKLETLIASPGAWGEYSSDISGPGIELNHQAPT